MCLWIKPKLQALHQPPFPVLCSHECVCVCLFVVHFTHCFAACICCARITFTHLLLFIHISQCFRMLTFCYLAAFNWWLVLCPSTLSHDWSMGSIHQIQTISDPRNLLTLLAFASTVLMLHRSLLDFEVCILTSVFQFKTSADPSRAMRAVSHCHHHHHYQQTTTPSRFLLNCVMRFIAHFTISQYLWFSLYSLSPFLGLYMYMVFLCCFCWRPHPHLLCAAAAAARCAFLLGHTVIHWPNSFCRVNVIHRSF